MNRTTALVLTAVLIFPAAMVLAEHVPATDAPTPAPGMMDKDTMGKGMMGKGMMGMMRPGMMGMMDRKVVATSDGGVVIVMGNKLSKYDKSLNLVKTVELTMNDEAGDNAEHAAHH